MCRPYNNMGVQILSWLNSYDTCSSATSWNADPHLEQGELAHRLVKRLYGRTNKRDATRQIGQRVRRLERAQLAADRHRLNTQSERRGIGVREHIDHDLEKRYYISNSWNNPVNLYLLVHKHQGDLAFHRFIPKLKDHILGCLLVQDYEGDTYGEFTDAEHNMVHIASKWIYHCKTI